MDPESRDKGARIVELERQIVTLREMVDMLEAQAAGGGGHQPGFDTGVGFAVFQKRIELGQKLQELEQLRGEVGD